MLGGAINGWEMVPQEINATASPLHTTEAAINLKLLARSHRVKRMH